ncbi:MAG: SdpI family protein [Chitinophagales bacterium]|nr:SdpI family protein [Chitinophagales bacterium]
MDKFQFLLTLQTILFYGMFFISGIILKLFPPSKNRFYGFRTTLALKNDYNWFFAQKTASHFILIFSPLFFMVSMLIKYMTNFIFQAFVLYTIIDSLLLIVATVMIFFLTQDKLRRMWKQKNQIS